MDIMRTLLIYMTATLGLAVQSTTAPAATPTPTPIAEETAIVETSYAGWWFYKRTFGVGSEETATKEESVEWRVPTLNGVGAGVRLDSSGKASFAVHKTFASETEAIAYVKGKAGIT